MRLCEPDWSGFLPPPPRTVHAVLPHTAHRRLSPAAFGLPRQGLLDLGGTTVPSPGAGLGRPVERSLQFSDLVLLGGTSHVGHSPVLPCAQRIDEAAALPSPRVLLSRQLKRYYGRLRRPPGTRPLPGRYAGYRTGPLRRTNTQAPGRVGPPQFPPSPSERSAPPTPGGPSGLQSRLFAPSMAFAVTVAARLLLFPTRRRDGLTTRQASLDATDRSVAPP